MTWSRDLTNTLDLIDNPSWSDDAGAYIVPREIESDASGNIYILSSVNKKVDLGFREEEALLGNTLTILSSSGLHIKTIEIANETDGLNWSSQESHRKHLAVSDTGTTLVNTGKKAYLIDFSGNITTIVDTPIQGEYTGSQLRSADYLTIVSIFKMEATY